MPELLIQEQDLERFENAVREGLRRIEANAAEERSRVEERAAEDLSMAVEQLDRAHATIAELRAQVASLKREAERHALRSVARLRPRAVVRSRA